MRALEHLLHNTIFEHKHFPVPTPMHNFNDKIRFLPGSQSSSTSTTQRAFRVCMLQGIQLGILTCQLCLLIESHERSLETTPVAQEKHSISLLPISPQDFLLSPCTESRTWESEPRFPVTANTSWNRKTNASPSRGMLVIE